jgi:hypothetical protein
MNRPSPTHGKTTIVRPDPANLPHVLDRLDQRTPASHWPSRTLQLRLERLDRVDGELGRDAADTARDKPGRAGYVGLVLHVVPVLCEEAFLRAKADVVR